MRKPVLLKKPPGQKTGTARPFSAPAPVKGLNSVDPITNMDLEFANVLLNWWPETNDVRVRKGFEDHSTGLPDQVESLMPYVKPDGTETLFAASNGNFYNVTSSGAVGAAVVTGLSNDRWDSINYTNSSGDSYLLCFNGSDNPRYWDNSSWVSVDSGSSPAITGVTSANLKAPWTHQRRLWAIEKNTLKAWYFPVDAVGGAATAVDLSGLCKLGGHLVAGGAYTFDAGDGPDDYWFAISSEGEVVAYAGTDPSSASTWGLIGVWRLGEPVGTRPILEYRGEALLLLREGVYPLSRALMTEQTDDSAAITFNIKEKIAKAVSLHGSKFGWQMKFYPEANMIILNVPIAEGSEQQQYCMNVLTGAWTVFDAIEANCWAIFQNQPYFGGNQVVGKFWGTLHDNNNNIDTDMQQAFSTLGADGRLKDIKLIKPYIFSDGAPDVLADVNTDFEDAPASGALTFSPSTHAVWDTDKWDQSTWGGALDINTQWQTAQSVGVYHALRLQSASNGLEVRLKGTDYLYEHGGIVG